MADPPPAAGPAEQPDLSDFLAGWKREIENKRDSGARAAKRPALASPAAGVTTASQPAAGDVMAAISPSRAAASDAAATDVLTPPPAPPGEGPIFVIRTRPRADAASGEAAAAATGRFAGAATAVGAFDRNRDHNTDTAGQPRGDAEPDLVQELINDLDEANDVPLLDFVLPRDVAMRILGSLDAVTLCRVSQLSSLWRTLADDNVLWHGICRCMRYRGELAPFAAVASWKAHVAALTLRRREIDRRWRRMEAAFATLEIRDFGVHHGDAREGSVVPVTASLFEAGGGCVAGHADGSVVQYNGDGERVRYVAAASRNPVAAVAAGSAVFAALTATPGSAAGSSGFAHAHPHHVPSRSVELEVWTGGAGGSVFKQPLPGEVSHAPVGLAGPQPGRGRAALHAHCREPTVFASTPASVRCYTAAHTGDWECAWETPAPPALESVRLVRDRALACLAYGGVSVLDARTGDIAAVLLDAAAVGVRCSALAVSDHDASVMFSAFDPTLSRTTLHVCDAATGRQRAAVDVAGGRAVSSIRGSADDPSLVLATACVSGTVRFFDLRADPGAGPAQTFRDASRPRGRACFFSSDWENWRVAAGGALGSAQGTVAVFDRRTSGRLWYVDVAAPLLDVLIPRDGAALWASSAAPAYSSRLESGAPGLAAPWDQAYFPPAASCLTVLDFAAPPAALAEASCPFSSSFDNVHGHRYDEELAAPYDNVTPDALG